MFSWLYYLLRSEAWKQYQTQIFYLEFAFFFSISFSSAILIAKLWFDSRTQLNFSYFTFYLWIPEENLNKAELASWLVIS